MYNSSLKGKNDNINYGQYKEIKNKVFYNDMSKDYMQDIFYTCDCIYSEISWQYGYSIFNERANNNADDWKQYIKNINRCIEELKIPSFIIAGKQVEKYFPKAKKYGINFIRDKNIGEAYVYVWHYNYKEVDDTLLLLKKLQSEFNKCLDFSCGYGEHLLGFKNFVACDINKNCLTYLCKKLNEGR